MGWLEGEPGKGDGQGVFVVSWNGRISFLRGGMIPNCGGVLE